MDPDAYVDIVDQILHPQRENAARILEDLGLSQPPTRERVHKALEAKILAPEDRLPSHWLPTYQV